jgi:hypothetical protein
MGCVTGGDVDPSLVAAEFGSDEDQCGGTGYDGLAKAGEGYVGCPFYCGELVYSSPSYFLIAMTGADGNGPGYQTFIKRNSVLQRLDNLLLNLRRKRVQSLSNLPFDNPYILGIRKWFSHSRMLSGKRGFQVMCKREVGVVFNFVHKVTRRK